MPPFFAELRRQKLILFVKEYNTLCRLTQASIYRGALRGFFVRIAHIVPDHFSNKKDPGKTIPGSPDLIVMLFFFIVIHSQNYRCAVCFIYPCDFTIPYCVVYPTEKLVSVFMIQYIIICIIYCDLWCINHVL